RRARPDGRPPAAVAPLVPRRPLRGDRDDARRPRRAGRRVPASGRCTRSRGSRGREPVTRLLATGFEPFGASPVNPSQQLLEAIDGEVATALLPVSYARAADALRDAVREAEPDVVICFGQADG